MEDIDGCAVNDGTLVDGEIDGSFVDVGSFAVFGLLLGADGIIDVAGEMG